jgi:hypothetical protein
MVKGVGFWLQRLQEAPDSLCFEVIFALCRKAQDSHVAPALHTYPLLAIGILIIMAWKLV